MRRFTLKTSIALLSVVALSAILLLFTVFVYFFLSHWLITREESATMDQVRQISLAYPSNLQEGAGEQTSQWLQSYLTKDQWVEIVSPAGKRLLSRLLPRQHRIPIKLSPLHLGTTIQTSGGHRFLRAVYPVANNKGTRIAWVILYSSVDQIIAFINALIRILVLGSLGAICLAGLIGYLVAHLALGPLDRIIRSIRNVDPNRLSYRLPQMRSSRELIELTDSFNKMLGRIEYTMNTQNRFVEDASHELRSPLAVIEGYVNLLDRWGKSDQAVLDRALSAIKKESSRLRRLTNDLLQLANLQTLPMPIPTIEIQPIVIDTVSDTQIAHKRAITIETCEEPAFMEMHPEHLHQLLMIFIDNAVKHTMPQDQIKVWVGQTTDEIRIAVQDEGEGIPKDQLPFIFDRFYRVDSSRDRKKGAGLGLAIAKELVELYKGSIEVSSVLDNGTVVTMVYKRRL